MSLQAPPPSSSPIPPPTSTPSGSSTRRVRSSAASRRGVADAYPAGAGRSPVIVGDIGLPGCEEIGHSPTLNNFDHHYSLADRSATFLFNQNTGHCARTSWPILMQLTSSGVGRRPRPRSRWRRSACSAPHRGVMGRSWHTGASCCDGLKKTGRPPHDLSGPMPADMQGYLRSGQTELRRIQEELPTMQRSTTRKGRKVGCLVSASPVVSIVKEEMFAVGMDIAVVYSSTTNRTPSLPMCVGRRRSTSNVRAWLTRSTLRSGVGDCRRRNVGTDTTTASAVRDLRGPG